MSRRRCFLAVGELHHQRAPLREASVPSRKVDDAVDVRDVGVADRGERLRFTREAGQPLGIGGEEVGQDLDRDVAIELRIAGAIHLAHSPGTDGGDDLVGAHLDARAHAHGCARILLQEVAMPRIFRELTVIGSDGMIE